MLFIKVMPLMAIFVKMTPSFDLIENEWKKNLMGIMTDNSITIESRIEIEPASKFYFILHFRKLFASKIDSALTSHIHTIHLIN